MNLQEARVIVGTLASGVHPTTGEEFAEDSPYNDPKVIRALFAVGEFIRRFGRQSMTIEEKQKNNIELGRPKNYGLRWSEEHRTRVASGFQAGTTLADLAAELGRTVGSIESELVKQGLIEAPDDRRWGGRPSTPGPSSTS